VSAFLISLLTGWGLPKWAANLLSYAIPVLIVLGALWYYGHSQYQAGWNANDAAWKTAIQQAKDDVDKAAGNASDDSVKRHDDFVERVTTEKGKVDAAIQDGSSPADALFGTR